MKKKLQNTCHESYSNNTIYQIFLEENYLFSKLLIASIWGQNKEWVYI